MKSIHIAGLVTIGVALLVLLAYVANQNTRPVGVEYTRYRSGATRWSTKPGEARYIFPPVSPDTPLINRKRPRPDRDHDAMVH